MIWPVTLALAALGKILPVQSGIDLYLAKELPMNGLRARVKDDILIAIELDSSVTDAIERTFQKFGIDPYSEEARAHIEHTLGPDMAEAFTDPEGT